MGKQNKKTSLQKNKRYSQILSNTRKIQQIKTPPNKKDTQIVSKFEENDFTNIDDSATLTFNTMTVLTEMASKNRNNSSLQEKDFVKQPENTPEPDTETKRDKDRDRSQGVKCSLFRNPPGNRVTGETTPI